MDASYLTVLRAMETTRMVDSEVTNLAADTEMDTAFLTSHAVRVRDMIHERAQDAGIVDEDVSVRDLIREANESYEVIAHRTARESPDDGGDPYAKFDAGLVAKLVYDTHHAPEYVMQLDNGHFIRQHAPVETSGENYPVGAPTSKVEEKFDADHVNIHWLEKEETPFREASKTTSSAEGDA